MVTGAGADVGVSISGVGGGVGSALGAAIGLGLGRFALFAFLFIVRLAFFFAPFFAFRLAGKQSHRLIVEAKMVIKVP